MKFEINEATIVRGRLNTIGVLFMDQNKDRLPTCAHTTARIHLINDDDSVLVKERATNVKWGQGQANVVSTFSIDAAESALLKLQTKADLQLEIVFASFTLKRKIPGFLTVVDPAF